MYWMDSYEHKKLVVLQFVGWLGSKLAIIISNQYLLNVTQDLCAQ